jgi:hypothetical protein
MLTCKTWLHRTYRTPRTWYTIPEIIQINNRTGEATHRLRCSSSLISTWSTRSQHCSLPNICKKANTYMGWVSVLDWHLDDAWNSRSRVPAGSLVRWRAAPAGRARSGPGGAATDVGSCSGLDGGGAKTRGGCPPLSAKSLSGWGRGAGHWGHHRLSG